MRQPKLLFVYFNKRLDYEHESLWANSQRGAVYFKVKINKKKYSLKNRSYARAIVSTGE